MGKSFLTQRSYRGFPEHKGDLRSKRDGHLPRRTSRGTKMTKKESLTQEDQPAGGGGTAPELRTRKG